MIVDHIISGAAGALTTLAVQALARRLRAALDETASSARAQAMAAELRRRDHAPRQ